MWPVSEIKGPNPGRGAWRSRSLQKWEKKRWNWWNVQNVDLAASNSPSRNMTANKSNHWDPQTTRNIQKYMQTCHGNEDYQIGFSWGEKKHHPFHLQGNASGHPGIQVRAHPQPLPQSRTDWPGLLEGIPDHWTNTSRHGQMMKKGYHDKTDNLHF